jgi:hypothetical protein
MLSRNRADDGLEKLVEVVLLQGSLAEMAEGLPLLFSIPQK